ncbi:MAG TPA: AAA family ATPase, partial [Planctomycetota bacterium]|nr:AAA family ATPase [Planctomycetota bacterium]
VSTLAKVLRLTFTRIQFTPDLMPSDITGSELIEQDAGGKKSFVFQQGPIFANILLADEINRTPPKTQAALLEAMQERQVTVSGKRYPLDPPFFVLATQNPIEQEGTYPLPEAQLDRFMFTITVDYPSLDEEREILRTTTVDSETTLTPILDAKRIVALQGLVRRIPVSEQVIDYALALTRCTRPKSKDAPDFIKQYIAWGAGPRSGQALILAAKALAILDGRPTPGLKDVAAMTKPVLRHRIATNFNADAEGIDADAVIEKIVAHVKPPAAK